MDTLYEIVAGSFKPDVTFLLDIDVKIGLERSFKKSQTMDTKELRFENVDVAFHERLRQGYLELAKQNPDRFIIINANQSIEDVTKEIIAKYEAFINKD
jgi:dTMP kinase